MHSFDPVPVPVPAPDAAQDAAYAASGYALAKPSTVTVVVCLTWV